MKMEKDPDIVFEDNHIIVVNKPSGVLTQGDISGDMSLLDGIKEYVRKKYGKPGEAFIGLVHRLDKPVSGLIVFARTSKAASRLQSQFISGEIEKFYLAVCDKKISRDGSWHRVENILVRNNDLTSVTGTHSINSQNAVLYYSEIENKGPNGLLLIRLETGRKHQIRAQLAGLSSPVLGDIKYGSVSDGGKRIFLHSVFLGFNHPVKKEFMEFYSNPDKKFLSSIQIEPAMLKELILEKIKFFRNQALLSRIEPFSGD